VAAPIARAATHKFKAGNIGADPLDGRGSTAALPAAFLTVAVRWNVEQALLFAELRLYKCARCKAHKPATEFYRKIRAARGLDYTCRECHLAAKRKRYAEDPDFRAKSRENCKRWYRENERQGKDAAARSRSKCYWREREWFNGLKDHPCADCGNNFPACCMDFDHRPGTVKLFNVGSGIRQPRQRILDEIAKCDLVCANCHRLRTYRRYARRQQETNS